MQQDDERMWADYFLHKTLSTGIEGTQTISVATVARAIQIVGMEKEARERLLPPPPPPCEHAHKQLTNRKITPTQCPKYIGPISYLEYGRRMANEKKT